MEGTEAAMNELQDLEDLHMTHVFLTQASFFKKLRSVVNAPVGEGSWHTAQQLWKR